MVLVIALVVAALLRAFVVQAFLVPTGSMENTIHPDQRIIVAKFGDVQRGDIVVFEDPGGWISPAEQVASQPNPLERALQFVGILPSTSTGHLVKRVIGLPGDTVGCCDRQGRIRVNGQPLDEASYLFSGDAPSQTNFKVVVPPGTMWVMGDHRSNSGDSRCHVVDGTGFVPLDLVTGRAVAVGWPLWQVHRLPVPATFTTVPPAPPAPGGPAVIRRPHC